MASSAPDIRAQLSELIAARMRLLAGIVAGGGLVMTVANQLLMPAVSPGLSPLQASGATMALRSVWLLHQQLARARPVPIGLLLFVVACVVRVAVGWLTHDLAATTIVVVGLILILATTVPWGLWPQLAAATLGAVAIAVNGVLIGVDVVGVAGPAASA